MMENEKMTTKKDMVYILLLFYFYYKFKFL